MHDLEDVQRIRPKRPNLGVVESETHAISDFIVEHGHAPFRALGMTVDLCIGHQISSSE
jgi:metallophosphoesterase superfamily enzyme